MSKENQTQACLSLAKLLIPEHTPIGGVQGLRSNYKPLYQLLIDTKYGEECPEVYDLKFGLAGKSLNPQHRYSENASWLDLQFPTYNMNQIRGTNLIIGEGPLHSNDTCRLFLNTAFNRSQSINTFIIAGKPNQGSKFYYYFADAQDISDFSISAHESADASNIVTHKLTIVNEKISLQQTVTAYQLTSLSYGELSELDIAKLYKIMQEYKSEKIFLHCDTGLGNSAAITLAMLIFEKFTDIFQDTEQQSISKISALLQQMRESRPRTIQTREQLLFAIQTGVRLYDYHVQQLKPKTKKKPELVSRTFSSTSLASDVAKPSVDTSSPKHSKKHSHKRRLSLQLQDKPDRFNLNELTAPEVSQSTLNRYDEIWYDSQYTNNQQRCIAILEDYIHPKKLGYLYPPLARFFSFHWGRNHTDTLGLLINDLRATKDSSELYETVFQHLSPMLGDPDVKSSGSACRRLWYVLNRLQRPRNNIVRSKSLDILPNG